MIYSLSAKPDILAITETKLNSNTVTNINIPVVFIRIEIEYRTTSK